MGALGEGAQRELGRELDASHPQAHLLHVTLSSRHRHTIVTHLSQNRHTLVTHLSRTRHALVTQSSRFRHNLVAQSSRARHRIVTHSSRSRHACRHSHSRLNGNRDGIGNAGP